MTVSKYQLRQRFRAIRSNIPTNDRENAALAAANLLKSLPIFKTSRAVACYLPYKDEFNSLPAIETIWSQKKNCYLPVLNAEKKTLRFALYQYGDRLHRNQFDILEPIKEDDMIAPEQLDLVLMPLIAFDAAGHRLGTGGGYYDRTFANIYPGQLSKPFFVGLAYAAQETETLPNDTWDIDLHAVITELKIITFSQC